MINSKGLASILYTIYGVPATPLNESEWVPTVKNPTISTWIGYRMLEVKPYTRAYVEGRNIIIPVQAKFRVTFVGEQAEEFALHTLLWDMRTDVIRAFEHAEIQLNYESRKVYTRPVKEEGLNDKMCWVVEFDCQSFYVEEADWPLWRIHNG